MGSGMRGPMLAALTAARCFLTPHHRRTFFAIVAAAPPTATTTSPAINTAPSVAIAYARAPPVANRARLPIAIRTRCSPTERARHHLTIPFIESPFPVASVLVEIDLGENLVDPRVKHVVIVRDIDGLEVELAK